MNIFHNSGEDEIRTRGRPYDSLANCWFQPPLQKGRTLSFERLLGQPPIFVSINAVKRL